MNKVSTLLIAVWAALLATNVLAEPWAAPGDMRLRNDLQLLGDIGAIEVPITTWPVSWGGVANALDDVNAGSLSGTALATYERLRTRARNELESGSISYRVSVAAAGNPRLIRSFENTPREDGEVAAGVAWIGNRFTVNLNATYNNNPFDGDEVRLDGTYVGVALGDWTLSAGWQERWWGPGRDSSMILSTNARPVPGLDVRRNVSTPFQSRWLSWMGAWSFAGFMGVLDDERSVNDAWLFGVRGSFRPLRGLEIGVSRTAQWCGDGRKCDLSTFTDLLLGKDNRGVNVDIDDEPGNQLGGFDFRWAMPKQIPVAIYAQWIGEDTRKGGPAIGSWLRQAGLEVWGTTRDVSHRTHLEIADSSCRTGGLGFSNVAPNCAYNHSIYRTGYRYNGRSLGHSIDGDGRSYSLGSTWLQSAGHSWNISLRHMQINRVGAPDTRHTLSASPQDIVDIQVSHERQTTFGRIHAGFGYSRLDDRLTGQDSSDISGFLRWSSQ